MIDCTYIQIAICGACNLFSAISCMKPTYCAFKNGDFQINATAAELVQNDWLRNKLEEERQKTWGVFLADGYERCEDSLNTSHCYTLWAKSSDTATPFVAKQG